MLRLTPRFALGDVAAASLPPGSELYLVGVSAPATLLLATDGAGREGPLQVYALELGSQKLQLLYTHAGRCKCVGASVDGGQAILALTQEELRDKDGEMKTYFKTSLAEIQPAGESYRLNVRSQLAQNVQFLQNKGGVMLFLFVIEGMFIRLYQMHSRKRAAGGVKITAQPLLLSEIVKKFSWYQWDAREEKLYVVTTTGSLRCYGFPKKEKLQFECPLGIPSVPSHYLGYRHFASSGRAVCASHLAMTVVSMGDGGLCFCLHHEDVITVYIVHHNVKLTIPCHSAVPVSFTRRLPSTLVIWVPGQSVTMVDCGLHHMPVVSLRTESPMVAEESGAFRHIVEVGEGILMDAHDGVVYSTDLDRAALLSCLTDGDVNNARLHMQCIHTAASLVDDDPELVPKMMRHALTQCSALAASPELFAEFITSTVYRKLHTTLPPHVAHLLPTTTLEPLLREPNATLLTHYASSIIKGQLYIADADPSPSPGVPGDAGVAAQQLLMSPSGHHFDGGSPIVTTIGSGSVIEPPSAVQRLVNILFGNSDADLGPSEEGIGDDGMERVSVCRSWGDAYEENLYETLSRTLSGRESRAKCLRMGKQIRRTQLEAVDALYHFVCDAVEVLQSAPAVLRVYENLYCVLEELSLPLPRGFAGKLATAALECLSPRLFVHYVDCGILFLSDDFIVNALRRYSLPSTTRVFLIGRIRNADTMIQFLRDDPEHSAAAVHYYAQQLGIQLPTAHQVEVLEGQDDSFFIPLTVFRDHVKRRDGVDGSQMVEFVYQFAREAIMGQLSAGGL